MVPAALALAIGRVGNWINQELFIAPWVNGAVIAKDLLIAAVVYAVLRSTKRPGIPTATFLVLYAILRFVSEYYRHQPLGYWHGLTPGQWYSVPLLVVGIVLLRRMHGSIRSVATTVGTAAQED